MSSTTSLVSLGRSIEAPLRIMVRHRADALAAAVVVRTLVAANGGTVREASAAATAVAELAQNIVEHAGGRGEVYAWVSDDILFVRAVDRGPGLSLHASAFGAASPTGAQGGSGLGQGAAAVRRLMDDVTVRTGDAGGLNVTASKRLANKGGIRWP